MVSKFLCDQKLAKIEKKSKFSGSQNFPFPKNWEKFKEIGEIEIIFDDISTQTCSHPWRILEKKLENYLISVIPILGN